VSGAADLSTIYDSKHGDQTYINLPKQSSVLLLVEAITELPRLSLRLDLVDCLDIQVLRLMVHDVLDGHLFNMSILDGYWVFCRHFFQSREGGIDRYDMGSSFI